MQKLIVTCQFMSAIVASILFYDSIKLKSWYITRNSRKYILTFIHNFTDFARKVTKNNSNQKVKERL